MGLLEYLDKLITEHGSAAILDKHLAFVREQALTLEKKVAGLEQENSRLKNRVSELETEISANTKSEEYVEHHGALFKRKPSGGYHSAVYCPSCRGTMSGFHTFPYHCNCGREVDFSKFDLDRIMRDLP
jgi:hypothetical protein